MGKETTHTDLPGRRDILLKAVGAVSLAGLTKAGVALAADASSVVLTPEMTQGPYWIDEKLNRAAILYDPSDETIQEGFFLVLKIKVYQIANGAASVLPNAQVDIWHCNAYGLYSDEAANGTSGKKFLRGYQITDSEGVVRFLSIYPGWYSGRTPHIHCRVRVYSNGSVTYNFTTQFFFDETVTAAVYQTAPYSDRGTQDTTNTTDNIYTTTDCMTGNTEGSETMLYLSQNAKYAVASIPIKLNLSLPNNSTCAAG